MHIQEPVQLGAQVTTARRRWWSPTPLKNDGVKVSWDDEIPNTKNDSYLFPIWVYFHMCIYIYICIWKNKNMFQTTTFVPHELSWLVAMPRKKRAFIIQIIPNKVVQTTATTQNRNGEISDSSPVDLSPPLAISDPRRQRRRECWIRSRHWKGQLWMSWKCHGNVMEMSWKYATFTATSHFCHMENVWIIVCHSHMSTTKIKSLVQARKEGHPRKRVGHGWAGV